MRWRDREVRISYGSIVAAIAGCIIGLVAAIIAGQAIGLQWPSW